MRFLALLLAAACGGCARHIVSDATARRVGTRLPWGTLAVNVSGSFALGLLYGLGTASTPETPLGDSAVAFLGGYTTVSAFALQADALMRQGRRRAWAVYVTSSLGLALLSAFAGHALGAALRG